LGLLALALLRGMAVPNCGLFAVFLIQPLEPASIMEVLAVAGLTEGLYLLVRGEAVDILETEPGFSSWQISRSSSRTDSVSVVICRTILSVMQPLDGQKTRNAFYVYVRDLDDVHRRDIQAGAKPIQKPAKAVHGGLMATEIDPFGNQWTIASRIEQMSVDELHRRLENLEVK
jgi:hypothetical protein